MSFKMTTKITLEELNEPRTKALLVMFDRYHEESIARVFGLRLTPAELIDLKYDENSQPELKLIWRFRQANCNPIVFWNALDPVNQKILEYHVGINNLTHILHFFVWVINHRVIPSCRTTQSIIEAFFFLTNDKQQEVVKSFNSMIDSRVVDEEIRKISARLEELLNEHEFPDKQNSILIKVIEGLNDFFQ